MSYSNDYRSTSRRRSPRCAAKLAHRQGADPATPLTTKTSQKYCGGSCRRELENGTASQDLHDREKYSEALSFEADEEGSEQANTLFSLDVTNKIAFEVIIFFLERYLSYPNSNKRTIHFLGPSLRKGSNSANRTNWHPSLQITIMELQTLVHLLGRGCGKPVEIRREHRGQSVDPGLDYVALKSILSLS